MKRLFLILIIILIHFLAMHKVLAKELKEYEKYSVPISQITEGADSSSLPHLTDPNFIPAAMAKYLSDEDLVIGVSINGKHKAYPIKMLNWHGVINDKIANKNILVSYCALSGSAIIFDSTVNQKRRLFKISGYYYLSNLLFEDEETHSLWSQLKKEAIVGPATGDLLKQIASEQVSWELWLKQHPDTLVLSNKNKHHLDYSSNPFEWYEDMDKPLVPVGFVRKSLKPKDKVLGIHYKDKAKAYPLDELRKKVDKNGIFKDKIAGLDLIIHYNKRDESTWVELDGKPYPSTVSYWYSWYIFNDGTKVYKNLDWHDILYVVF